MNLQSGCVSVINVVNVEKHVQRSSRIIFFARVSKKEEIVNQKHKSKLRLIDIINLKTSIKKRKKREKKNKPMKTR